ncbi:MAG TPA: amidase [Terracidiphilus sp.]
MKQLVTAPAVEQLAALQAGEVTVSELAEQHLAQIARLNPALNAFADFDAERVRTEARRLDAHTGPRGKLHGLPVTVKSSISTAGLKCEIGSLLNKGSVPTEDAVLVARLRAAGALILGATNCPEFLMAYESANLLHGRVANPWNLDCTPGGSSGGESAAIAAGMSAAGLGSDSGGSVRVPAHFTGICSLKPTPGRFPGAGHLPPCVGPFSILGAIGPMARTMRDVTLMFEALNGPDANDPAGVPLSYRARSLDELRAQPIGYFEDDGLVPVTQETRAAVRAAVEVLRQAGFRVEPFRPQQLEPLRKLWWTFFVQCGEMFYRPTYSGHQAQLSPIFREFLTIAQAEPEMSSMQLLIAWANLDLVRARMLEEMQQFPVLLCPVASVPAWRHGERTWNIDGREVHYLDAVRHTQWFNALGSPAAMVPVGNSPDGLPIGVQIAARPYEDEVALGIASIVDEAFGYRVPPMAQL